MFLAACGTRWIEVAPGTPPIECVSARLAARGWTVDPARTDSVRIRVTKREGIYEYIVTGQILPPDSSSYVRVNAEWWRHNVDPPHHIGSVIDDAVEMRNALQSCGVRAYGWRPVNRPRG